MTMSESTIFLFLKAKSVSARYMYMETANTQSKQVGFFMAKFAKRNRKHALHVPFELKKHL